MLYWNKGLCKVEQVGLYSIRRRLATSATLLNAKAHQLPSWISFKQENCVMSQQGVWCYVREKMMMGCWAVVAC
jgi:hypothetical protein